MFKLGNLLLFITFTQIIAVTMFMYMKRKSELIMHMPPLIICIVAIELIYSTSLIIIGYFKGKGVFDNSEKS
jgi:hypothetical protein